MTAVIEGSGGGGIRILRNGVQTFSTDDQHVKQDASGTLVFHNGETFDARGYVQWDSFFGNWERNHQERMRDVGLNFAAVTDDHTIASNGFYSIPAFSQALTTTRGSVNTVGAGGTGAVEATGGRFVVGGPGGTFDTNDQHLHLVRYFSGTLNWAAPGDTSVTSQSDQTIGAVTAQENVVIGIVKLTAGSGFGSLPAQQGKWVTAGGTIAFVGLTGTAYTANQINVADYLGAMVLFDFLFVGGNLICRRKLRVWNPFKTITPSVNARHNALSGAGGGGTQQLDYRIYTGAWS